MIKNQTRESGSAVDRLMDLERFISFNGDADLTPEEEEVQAQAFLDYVEKAGKWIFSQTK